MIRASLHAAAVLALSGASLLAASVASAAPAADTMALLESGRLDSAIVTLERELGDNPYDAVALNNLAVARARNAEVFSALDLLDRAVRLEPENPQILGNRDMLRDWIARRISAGRGKLELVPTGTQRLPEPPPLWSP